MTNVSPNGSVTDVDTMLSSAASDPDQDTDPAPNATNGLTTPFIEVNGHPVPDSGPTKVRALEKEPLPLPLPPLYENEKQANANANAKRDGHEHHHRLGHTHPHSGDHHDEADLRLNPEQQINLYSFLSFWTTIGLYTLLGAWIFQLIERQPELTRINATYHDVENARNNLMRQIEKIQLGSCALTSPPVGNVSSNTSTSASDSSTIHAESNLDQLMAAIRTYELVLDRVTSGGLKIYFNSTVNEVDTNWSLFPRALSFVVTLITTIGYGNISPRTPWGRIFCIAYALLGIPLMLIVISRSGKIFAALAGRAYRRLCGNRFDWKYLSAQNPTNLQLMVNTYVSVNGVLVVLFVYIAIGAWMYKIAEGWTYLDAFYFCFITVTTIGLGDLTPHIETTPTLFAIMRSVYILVGLALTSTAIELVRKQYTIWNRPWRRTLEIGKAHLEAAVEQCGEEHKKAAQKVRAVGDVVRVAVTQSHSHAQNVHAHAHAHLDRGDGDMTTTH